MDVRVHDGLQRITRLLNEEARCFERRRLCSLQDVDMNCDLVSYRVNLPGCYPRGAIAGHHRKRVWNDTIVRTWTAVLELEQDEKYIMATPPSLSSSLFHPSSASSSLSWTLIF